MATATSDKPEISMPSQEPEIDCSQIKFAPATPIPGVFDVEARIKQLRSYLEPNCTLFVPEYQHANILAAIRLYEEGIIKGERVYIMNGKIVSKEEAHQHTAPYTVEGVFYQRNNKCSYGHGPFGAQNHEVIIFR